MAVSGESSDMREIIASMKEGSKRSKYAYDIFVYRIKKYIGAYAAAMGGVDAIILTGGVGVKTPSISEAVFVTVWNFLALNLTKKETQKKKFFYQRMAQK